MVGPTGFERDFQSPHRWPDPFCAVGSNPGLDLNQRPRLLPPIELTGLQEVPIELTVAGSIRDPVELLSKIEQTSRLLAVKDRKVRVVAVGQPREVLTTPTVAGYLLPANGNNP